MRLTSDRIISIHPIESDSLEAPESVLKVLSVWAKSPYTELRDVIDPNCTLSITPNGMCLTKSVRFLSEAGLENPQLQQSQLALDILAHAQVDSIPHDIIIPESLFDKYLLGKFGQVDLWDIDRFSRALALSDKPVLCVHLLDFGPIHTKLAELMAFAISQSMSNPNNFFSRRSPTAKSYGILSPTGTYSLLGIETLLPTRQAIQARTQILALRPLVCVAQSLLFQIGRAMPEIQPYLVPVKNRFNESSNKDLAPVVRVDLASKVRKEQRVTHAPSWVRFFRENAISSLNLWAIFVTSTLMRIYQSPRLVDLALHIARTKPRTTNFLRRVVKTGERRRKNPFLRIDEMQYLESALSISNGRN